jgi:hypothetical protein
MERGIANGTKGASLYDLPDSFVLWLKHFRSVLRLVTAGRNSFIMPMLQ